MASNVGKRAETKRGERREERGERRNEEIRTRAWSSRILYSWLLFFGHSAACASETSTSTTSVRPSFACPDGTWFERNTYTYIHQSLDTMREAVIKPAKREHGSTSTSSTSHTVISPFLPFFLSP